MVSPGRSQREWQPSVRVRGSRDNLTIAELNAGIAGRDCFRLMDREGSRKPQARVKSGHEGMYCCQGCLRMPETV